VVQSLCGADVSPAGFVLRGGTKLKPPAGRQRYKTLRTAKKIIGHGHACAGKNQEEIERQVRKPESENYELRRRKN
jgi:hypothetical protein